MAGQSPIFIRTEAFIVWLLEHTRRFPRYERFRLARRIEEAAFGLHECLVRAAQTEDAGDHLLEADIQLDLLRSYLRLALELRYTSHRQYQYAAQQTAEIGRLLGGWLKKVAR